MDLDKIGGALSSFAPAAGVVTSLVGSVIGNKQSKDNVRYQMEMQRRENALNREFNAREAEKNRLFQQSQIMDYRRYNSPMNQSRLMQEAGYHPMTALGQFGSMDAGLSSGAQASSGGSISPVGYQPLDISQAANLAAQTKVLESQARKNDAEADDAEASAATENAMRDGKLTYQNVEIDLGKAATAEKQENVRVLANMVLKIDQDIAESKERLNQIVTSTAGLRLDNYRKALDNAWQSDSYQARLAQEAARAGVSVMEYKYAQASFNVRLLNMMADTNSKLAQAAQSSSMAKFLDTKRDIANKEWDTFSQIDYNLKQDEHQRMRLDFKIDSTWKEVETQARINQIRSGMARDFVNVVGQGLDIYGRTRGRGGRIGF